jgi:hypothetical protein
MKPLFFAVSTLTFLWFSPVSVLAQGSLTPPGARAATMKTLQQVEPRIDLQNAPASAVTTNDPSYAYIIKQAGSYYLSASILGAAKPNAIQIEAAGVTLDLNGFEIGRSSGGGAGNYGVRIRVTADGASIQNGFIRGYLIGIDSEFAGGEWPQACAFRRLVVSGCTGGGIRAGPGAVFESCTAHGNSGNDAITAGVSSSLTNCTVSGNTVTTALRVGDGSTVTNCTSTGTRVNTGSWRAQARH